MNAERSSLEDDVPVGTARIKELLTDPLGILRSFSEVSRGLEAQKAAFPNRAFTGPAAFRDKFIFGMVRPPAADAEGRSRL